MKITLAWLRDHLDTESDLATIVARLTMLGHEVDAIANGDGANGSSGNGAAS